MKEKKLVQKDLKFYEACFEFEVPKIHAKNAA